MEALALRERSSIELEDIEISYGLADDPTDERLQYFLVEADPDNLPTMNAALDSNFWVGMQIWRAVGTPANVLDTVTQSDDEGLEGEIAHDVTIPNHSLCIIATSDNGSLARVVGTIDFVESLVQRQVRDDPSEYPYSNWAESAYACC